jgi:hypothetical protein
LSPCLLRPDARAPMAPAGRVSSMRVRRCDPIHTPPYHRPRTTGWVEPHLPPVTTAAVRSFCRAACMCVILLSSIRFDKAAIRALTACSAEPRHGARFRTPGPRFSRRDAAVGGLWGTCNTGWTVSSLRMSAATPPGVVMVLSSGARSLNCWQIFNAILKSNRLFYSELTQGKFVQ